MVVSAGTRGPGGPGGFFTWTNVASNIGCIRHMAARHAGSGFSSKWRGADATAPASFPCRKTPGWYIGSDMADLIMLEDFWAKSESRPSPLFKLRMIPPLAPVCGPVHVELASIHIFQIASELLGHTIQLGGRCRAYLGGHTQFFKDTRRPLPQ